MNEQARRSTAQVNSWPHDEDGRPMTIVVGTASDLIPTVQYGNVVVGPVQIMRPIKDPGDADELANAAREVQQMAQWVTGVERRLAQWAIDPSTRIMKPSEQNGDEKLSDTARPAVEQAEAGVAKAEKSG